MIKEVNGVKYETFAGVGCGECIAAPQFESALCKTLSGYADSGFAPDCTGIQWKESKPVSTSPDNYIKFVKKNVVVEVEGNKYESFEAQGCSECVAHCNKELCESIIAEARLTTNPQGLSVCAWRSWKLVQKASDGFLNDTKLLARINALKSGKMLMMKHHNLGTHSFFMPTGRNVILCVGHSFVGSRCDALVLWGDGEWFILEEVEEEVTETITKTVKKIIEVKL